MVTADAEWDRLCYISEKGAVMANRTRRQFIVILVGPHAVLFPLLLCKEREPVRPGQSEQTLVGEAWASPLTARWARDKLRAEVSPTPQAEGQ